MRQISYHNGAAPVAQRVAPGLAQHGSWIDGIRQHQMEVRFLRELGQTN